MSFAIEFIFKSWINWSIAECYQELMKQEQWMYLFVKLFFIIAIEKLI